MPITATTAQCQRLDTRGVHFTTWMVYLWCMFNLEFSNLQLFHFDTLSFGGTQWGPVSLLRIHSGRKFFDL